MPGASWALRAPGVALDVRRVTVIYDPACCFDRDVVRGVAAFAHEDARLLVDLEQMAPGRSIGSDSRTPRAEGVIATAGALSALAGVALPVVGFGAGRLRGPRTVPPVYLSPDDDLVVTAAIDHLIEHGFRSVTYYGSASDDRGWYADRRLAVRAIAEARGLAVPMPWSAGPVADAGRDGVEALVAWIGQLPKPVGIVTRSDSDGRAVLEACHVAGVHVPEDVGVVGMGNDELLCQLSRPTLSSVDTGGVAIGRRAAAALMAWLDGASPAEPGLALAPLGVVPRQSTESFVADDAVVKRAMSFIWDQACSAIAVPDVVRATAVSRSTLEARFRLSLNCTVHDAIRRAHLQRAQRLMVETSLPLKQVAAASGFKTVQHLTTRFVKAFGLTPARYRRTGPWTVPGLGT